MSRQTRRSSPRRSHRSWPAVLLTARSCGPAWDRRCAPRCRPRAPPWPRHAHSRRSPPSPPCSPGACEARQPACGDHGRCSDTPAAMRARECTHHLVLCDVDTHDNEIILCHHPLPSLLGSGSKPLQLFGLRKTPELSLALTQALSLLGATGSVPATGGWCAAARLHILTDLLDTRAQGMPGARCTRGRAWSVVNTRVSHHRFTGTPGLPCAMVLTVSFVISPVIGLVCHRRLRGVSGPLGLTSPSANLTPASRRQDHTTSPSAGRAFVKGAACVHRIPRQRP